MKVFLFFALSALVSAFLIPIATGSQRCMVIYSIDQEDSIKISVKFPEDHAVEKFYDYITEIRDLAGNTITFEKVENRRFKAQLIVPNQTIYETCIRITPNLKKSQNLTHRYQGEIMIDYEANTHFIIDDSKTPSLIDLIKDEEITALKKQVNQVINATQQYMKLQTSEKQAQRQAFNDRRYVQDSLFEWWMVELVVILGVGAYQWTKMKHKIANKQLY